MATLQDAIRHVQKTVRQVEGIRAAPEYPEDNMAIYPFAVAFADSGRWDYGPGYLAKRGLHTIVVEVHVARKDLSLDVEAAMKYSDSVPDKLMYDPTLGGNVDTIGGIRYEFGPLGWADQLTIGFRFFIEDIKMISDIEG
jgi:hypothetical protein